MTNGQLCQIAEGFVVARYYQDLVYQCKENKCRHRSSSRNWLILQVNKPRLVQCPICDTTHQDPNHDRYISGRALPYARDQWIEMNG